jgi:hypothetical protein
MRHGINEGYVGLCLKVSVSNAFICSEPGTFYSSTSQRQYEWVVCLGTNDDGIRFEL